MIKLRDLLSETVTRTQLQSLERYADQLFAAVGIDIAFTKHFFDQVNNSRNIPAISPEELTHLFKNTYQKYGKKIKELGVDAEAVIHDMENDINVPFILQYDSNSQEIDLVAKTVMRKKNFASTNQKFNV